MYFDTKPCSVCGSEVTLRARDTPPTVDTSGTVGPVDGVVGDGDSTVDERVCTNSRCATNQGRDSRDSSGPRPCSAFPPSSSAVATTAA